MLPFYGHSLQYDFGDHCYLPILLKIETPKKREP